jgi:short-subunit dehydrogenase
MNESASFAVITGASSGIGLELARQFAQHGFDVLICAEDDELASAAADLASAGTQVQTVRSDLATVEGVEQLIAAVEATGRPVDALALNAGVGNGGAFLDIALAEEQRLIALNIGSVVHLAKRLLPAMVARGSGGVLFTASVASTMPGPYYATYAASKAFVLSFAEAIRYELKDSGVTITALMPGPTDTEFFDRADMGDTPVDSIKKDDPAQVAGDGFEALMAGKDHVVGGPAKNKVQTVAGKLLSEPAKAAIHARMTKPQSD